MRRIQIALLPLAWGVAGCTWPVKNVIVEEPTYRGPPTIRDVSASGDSVKISLIQDSKVGPVGKITARVIDGDVYLGIAYVLGSNATEFVVDLSGSAYPQDWRSKLYWLNDTVITKTPDSIVRIRELHRYRIQLEE